MRVMYCLAVAAAAVVPYSNASPMQLQPTQEPNMNGEYFLSETPGGDHTQEKFPTNYRDYPGGLQYFDVYSPEVSSLYSQVFWKGLDPVPLPEEVVQRFAGGKAMAVVGYELDQVRKTPEGDVSLPINVAYNHHFESEMIGAGSYFEKIVFDGPDDPRRAGHSKMGHGVPNEIFVAREYFTGASPLPTKASFGGANGGEIRKSFHGYAPGFAQVITSPENFQITPMQIDTWHRERMNLTGSPFVSGPVPRNSLAPTGPGAQYSGLLECPVSTRLQKIIDAGYEAIAVGRCRDVIQTASECFVAAARELGSGPTQLNASINDESRTSACSAQVDPTTGATTVIFNGATPNSTADCGAHAMSLSGETTSLVTLNVSLDLSKQEVTIRISGPDAVWFGVGFDAQAMKDAPWALIVDGNGVVTERKLADQNPGKLLAKSITVVSSQRVAGRRSVVVTRPMKGATPDHYTFSAAQNPLLPFINAVGSGPDLAYHKDKTSSFIALLPVAGPAVGGACICAHQPAPFGQAKGKFNYIPVKQPGEMGKAQQLSFSNKCAPAPRSSLYEQRNPTCDIRTYVGGQLACHHMFSLLDADQEIPWVDRPLNYHLKFRFWYQEYNESYHTNVFKGPSWDLGAGHGGTGAEYDVPKCAEGVAGCSRGADGYWVHTIHGIMKGTGVMVAAHMHCHAPTCLSMAVYNNATGDLICMQKPIYGGTGKIPERKYDEPGFILVPPCLWGSREQGLEPPPDLDGIVLHVVKTANATYGHHGEMAHGQVYYAKRGTSELTMRRGGHVYV